MATREQVAFRLREYERRESQLNDEGMITLGTLRLALRALDTERDAALGAFVRPHIPAILEALETDAQECDFGHLHGVAGSLRAIAAHLREEQKGGG